MMSHFKMNFCSERKSIFNDFFFRRSGTNPPNYNNINNLQTENVIHRYLYTQYSMYIQRNSQRKIILYFRRCKVHTIQQYHLH